MAHLRVPRLRWTPHFCPRLGSEVLKHGRKWNGKTRRRLLVGKAANGSQNEKNGVGGSRNDNSERNGQEEWSYDEVREAILRLKPFRSGLLVLLTFAYVGLYIYESSHTSVPDWAIMVDRALILVFAADYMISLFLANKEWASEAFSFEGCITLASFLPQLLEEIHLDFLPEDVAGVTRVLRVLRVLRLAVVLPYLQAAGIISKDAVQLRLASLVITISGLLLTTASIVQVAEKVSWLDALYFVLTTITTVGYGDITAHTLLGKFTVIGMLLAALLLVPVQTSQLVSLLVARRQKLGNVPKSKSIPTLLMVTQLNDYGRFFDSFEEIFHETKDVPANYRLVCLCSKPEFEYRALQELNQGRLTFCEGSALAEDDLHKAGLQHVQAALLMVDRFPKEPEEEDRSMLLKLWSIKAKNPEIPLVVQVLDHAMQTRMQAFLGLRDQAISLRRAKNRLLSTGVHCPGACTLISNLLTGVSGTTASSRIAATRSALREGRKPPRWVWEYIDGAAHEVYAVQAPTECTNLYFCKFSTLVYSQSSAVLLGISPAKCARSRKVFLNPNDYKIKAGDLLLIMAKSSTRAQEAVQKSLKYVSVLAGPNDKELPQSLKAGKTQKIPVISSLRGSFDELFSVALPSNNNDPTRVSPPVNGNGEGESLLLCGDLDRIVRFLRSYNEFWRSDKSRANSPLRVRYIYPDQPERSTFEELSNWGAEWFKGSPTNGNDLINAGVLKGARLVVLSYASQDGLSPSTSDLPSVTDTDAIQIAYLMEEIHRTHRNYGEPPYIVELDFTDSEKFLQPQVLPHKADLLFDDPSTCINWEALGEPFRNTGTGTNHGKLLQRLCNPFYAAGHIYVPAVLDRIAISALNPGTPAAVGIINEVFEEMTKFNKIQLWEMPEELVGRTYGSLFLKFMAEGVVPLGLYRDRGRKGSQLHYVCANPAPNTLLAASDKIYLISPDRTLEEGASTQFEMDASTRNATAI